MTPEHEFFRPERVDEQIARPLPEDRALHTSYAAAESQPEARLVKDLQGYYQARRQQDLASLERAWQQVSKYLDESQAYREPIDKLPSTKRLRSPHERTHQMLNPTPAAPRERRPSRRLSLLAAILVATILVGAMVAVFKLAHQTSVARQQGHRSNISSAASPTSLQSIPSSPGLYLITLADTSENFQVTKVDKHTGAVLWNHTIGVSESSVVVADNLVFGSSGDPDAYAGTNAPNNHSYVYALNAKTGTQIWRTDLGADYTVTNSFPSSVQGIPVAQGYNLGILGTPTYADGVVYVTSAAGKVYALNAASGTILWTYNAHAIDYDLSSSTAYFVQTLAVANNLVYGATLNKLYALDARNGHEVWSALASTRSMFGSPTVTGGRVYLSVDPLSTHTENLAKSHIVAYSADHGTQLWQSDGYYWAGFLNDAPVVANSLVYVANAYTGIYALDEQTGHTRWQHILGTDAFNNPDGCTWPVVADGVVYTNCSAPRNSTLHAYNAARGTLIWSRASTADPADIDHGVLYATAFPGLVYFVKASNGTTAFHKTYGLVTKDKFGNASAPEPSLTLVP